MARPLERPAAPQHGPLDPERLARPEDVGRVEPVERGHDREPEGGEAKPAAIVVCLAGQELAVSNHSTSKATNVTGSERPLWATAGPTQ